MLTDTDCKNAKPQDKPYKKAGEKGMYLLIDTKVNGQTIDECISYIIINRLNEIGSAIGDEMAVAETTTLH